MDLKTAGFAGGGQMAEALIKGMLTKGLVKKEKVYAADPSPERRRILEKNYGINVYASSEEVCKASDTVILAVKPQVMQTVLASIAPYVNRNHLIISIAAGITLQFIESGLPEGTKVVRVMPNTPALVLQGAAGICRGANADHHDLELVTSIFNAVGATVQVNEPLMDAVTGLSGSGPAYCFAFVQGLIDAGVREGLSRPDAEKLAIQTMAGSAELLLKTGKSPSELTAMVTSPGGTTIEGLFSLEKGAFRATIMEAVRSATIRSKELGGR